MEELAKQHKIPTVLINELRLGKSCPSLTLELKDLQQTLLKVLSVHSDVKKNVMTVVERIYLALFIASSTVPSESAKSVTREFHTAKANGRISAKLSMDILKIIKELLILNGCTVSKAIGGSKKFLGLGGGTNDINERFVSISPQNHESSNLLNSIVKNLEGSVSLLGKNKEANFLGALNEEKAKELIALESAENEEEELEKEEEELEKEDEEEPDGPHTPKLEELKTVVETLVKNLNVFPQNKVSNLENQLNEEKRVLEELTETKHIIENIEEGVGGTNQLQKAENLLHDADLDLSVVNGVTENFPQNIGVVLQKVLNTGENVVKEVENAIVLIQSEERQVLNEFSNTKPTQNFSDALLQVAKEEEVENVILEFPSSENPTDDEILIGLNKAYFLYLKGENVVKISTSVNFAINKVPV